MTNKEKYNFFCNKAYVPVFSQPWWLDAVCVNGYWDVLLYEKGEEILGALPYYVKKKFGISYITQPKFTQNNGVILYYPENLTHEKKLSFEKEVMTALIDKLEKLPIVFYQQSFHYSITNWLPFYWKRYKQTTIYTYVINDIKNETNLISRYNDGKKKDIKCAAKFNLLLKEDLSTKIFYENHKINLKKRSREISYSQQLLERMVTAAYANNSGKILYVEDLNGRILSAQFLLLDSKSAYCLIIFTDQDNKNTGASSLLFNACIKYSSHFVDSYDFEGSMDENIENSYRKFGTTQTPYFYINKLMTKNPLLRFMINRKFRD